MSGELNKSLDILEFLAKHPEGKTSANIAKELNQLHDGCRRVLNGLIRCGYVRQLPEQGGYVLTAQLTSIGLRHMEKSGALDVAQLIVDSLAARAGERAKLAVVDGGRLKWVCVSKAPMLDLQSEMDQSVELDVSSSAAGHAWLMTMTEQQVMAMTCRRASASPVQRGSGVPKTLKALFKVLAEDRRRGYAVSNRQDACGLSTMAMPVWRKGGTVMGVIAIAGPSVRLTEVRMTALRPALLIAAEELTSVEGASRVLKSSDLGT